MGKKSSGKSRSSGPPKITGAERIVALAGGEVFLQGEYLRQLREAIESKTGEEVESLRFDGKSAEPADVLDEARSFSLMQRHKLIVVDQAEALIQRHRQTLERYAEQPVEMATLVLRADSWNKSWRLHKRVEQVGAVIPCEPPTEAQAQRWLGKRARKRYGAELKPDAAARMVERLGTDLGRLDGELAKLAVGADGPITPEQVDRLVGRGSEEKAWEIQEALLSGDADRAIGKLHELLDLSRQPKELVAHFVADLVRKLHHAAVLLREGHKPFEVCKELKVFGDRQKPFLAAARTLGIRRAARLLGELVELDRRAKSGFGDHAANLERFCVQFTAELR